MRLETFEARIRKVELITPISDHYRCFVYDIAEKRFLKRLMWKPIPKVEAFDLADDMVKIAKEMSRVPQKLCLITCSHKKSKIIRIEPL